MIHIKKSAHLSPVRGYDSGWQSVQIAPWSVSEVRRLEDDDFEGLRNWAIILLFASLMIIPFGSVAWLLA